MSNDSKYAASLFTQFLDQELRKNSNAVLPDCIGRALTRFSPVASPMERRAYVDSIFSTIADKDGNLLYPGDMEKQINQIFDNMEKIVNQANFKLSDVVRFTYYTTDVQAFTKAGPVLGEHLEKAGCRPATSLIGLNSLFHPDCVVEIEAIAVD